ncbi:MAG: transporter substrate-binding domain-containing protein [Rhodospirillaceae bacterium]|nr:transporter substrate-binding domain-containing protein [Rhodospirillaceae bacterium]
MVLDRIRTRNIAGGTDMTLPLSRHLLAKRLLAGVASAMLCLVAAVDAEADPVRLRADYWCPYNCDPGEKYPGYMIEIAQRAMARLGIVVDYQLMPWDRAMSEVRDGRIDGAVGATALEADGLILSDPLGMDADCFFVTPQSRWRYDGIESLHGVLIGAASGYTHDEGPIDAYIAANDRPQGRVTTTTGDDASLRNIRLLLVGRVDVILDSRSVVAMEAARQGQAKNLVTAGCLEALPIHIALSPRNKDAARLVGALREEVGELRKSGRLAKIMGHYGLNDWQP